MYHGEMGKGFLGTQGNTRAKEKPFLKLGAGAVVEERGAQPVGPLRVCGGVGTE